MIFLRTHAFWLWTLLGLFALRVVGQLLASLGWAPFLPPMEEWSSGILAYPALLASQVVILTLYSKVCLDFTRGRGYFAVPRRRLGVGLLWFGTVYLIAMIVRYILRMSMHPEERWLGGAIPIVFHWVLAAFLLTVGQYHWSRTARWVC